MGTCVSLWLSIWCSVHVVREQLWEPVLSLDHVVSRDWNQVIRLGNKHLYLQSHLAGPGYFGLLISLAGSNYSRTWGIDVINSVVLHCVLTVRQAGSHLSRRLSSLEHGRESGRSQRCLLSILSGEGWKLSSRAVYMKQMLWERVWGDVTDAHGVNLLL